MSNLARFGFAAAVATCVVAGACSNAPGERGREQVQIIGENILDGTADSVHTFVVGLTISSAGAWCSGTLIAPNLVLTAQHCIASCPHSIDCHSATFGPACNAESVFITFASDMFTAPSYSYLKAAQVYVPQDSNAVCGNDVALIRLVDNVPAHIATPANPRVDIQVADGEIYTAIGYGNVNGSGSGAGARRYRDGLQVLCVGGVSCDWKYAGNDREWQGNTGICSGDSGGPAIDSLGRVIGVVSRGAEGCTFPTYGSVYGWAEWIKSIGAECAQAGGYEPAPWVTGGSSHPEAGVKIDAGNNKSLAASCDANDQCTSGVCAKENDLTQYCSTSCTQNSDCVYGWHCDTAQAVCLQNAGFGAPCVSSYDCRTGMCLTQDAASFCTQACDGDAGAVCPNSGACVDGKCQLPPAPAPAEVKVESKSGCATSTSGSGAGVWWVMALGLAALLRRRG